MRKPTLSVRMLLVGALAAGLLGGCEVKYTQPQAQPKSLSAAEEDFEAVWQAARTTLRRHHFELDRQDRRAGVITTVPMTGMHFFEFWREDAARPADYAESTVQTIYRTAQVTVRPTQPQAETYQANVQVFLSRSSRGTPQVTSTSEAYSLFSMGRDRRARRRFLEASDWARHREGGLVDLGNDRSLEAKLTAEIAQLSGRPHEIEPPAPPIPTPAATQPSR